MSITIELPDRLAEQFKTRQISERKIRAVALAALESWLAKPETEAEELFNESAEPFARRLITLNRELFEKLAQR
jgi:hypothetical protein